MKRQGASEYLLALVGHPVAHSLSPPMHEAALAHFGLKGHYHRIDLKPEDLKTGVSRLTSEGYLGFNVTVPHKESVFALCDEHTSEAKLIGAVNAVKIDCAGRLVGHNTDMGGFVQALAEALPEPIKKKAAYVIGAGGAARAAICGLVSLGWPEIIVVARDLSSAGLMIEEVKSRVSQGRQNASTLNLTLCAVDLSHLPSVPDLVINATPIGLAKDEAPDWVQSLLKCIHPQGFFFDLVYSPADEPTSLVALAEKLRLLCMDGSEMLIQQAALAFQFWTGLKPPLQLMRQALREARLGCFSSRE